MPGEIEVMAAPIEIFIDPDKALVRTLIQRHDHLPVLRVLGADDQEPVLQVAVALAFEQRHFGSIVLDASPAWKCNCPEIVSPGFYRPAGKIHPL